MSSGWIGLVSTARTSQRPARPDHGQLVAQRHLKPVAPRASTTTATSRPGRAQVMPSKRVARKRLRRHHDHGVTAPGRPRGSADCAPGSSSRHAWRPRRGRRRRPSSSSSSGGCGFAGGGPISAGYVGDDSSPRPSRWTGTASVRSPLVVPTRTVTTRIAPRCESPATAVHRRSVFPPAARADLHRDRARSRRTARPRRRNRRRTPATTRDRTVRRPERTPLRGSPAQAHAAVGAQGPRPRAARQRPECRRRKGPRQRRRRQLGERDRGRALSARSERRHGSRSRRPPTLEGCRGWAVRSSDFESDGA